MNKKNFDMIIKEGSDVYHAFIIPTAEAFKIEIETMSF